MNHQQKRTTRQYQAEYDNHKIILRPRSVQRRRTRELIQSLVYPVTLAFALSICFSGVGALGCWGFEIIAANASPTSISSKEWRSPTAGGYAIAQEHLLRDDVSRAVGIFGDCSSRWNCRRSRRMMEMEPIDVDALDIDPEKVVKFLLQRDWKSTEVDNPEDGSKVIVLYSPDNKGFLLPPKDYGDYEDKLLEVLRHYQYLISPRINEICAQIQEVSIPFTQE